MSSDSRMIGLALRQEEFHRNQLLRIVLWIGLGGAAIALGVFVIMGLWVEQSPAPQVVPIIIAFCATTLLSFWLLRLGQMSWAISVYLVSLSIGLFVAAYFLNGTSGPVAVALILVPILAALLGGRTVGRWFAIAVSAIYIVLAVLEALGYVRPHGVSGQYLQILYNGMILLTLATTGFLVIYSGRQMQSALWTAQLREGELAVARLRAEQATLAEREARGREERSAARLRQTVQEYSTFLERVTAGDYGARLSLASNIENGGSSDILQQLGQRLVTTVETLVTALNSLQAAQQRYVLEAWEGYVKSAPGHRGFRYLDADVEPDDDAWMGSMAAAVREKRVEIADGILAVPISLRGEVIGSIGARREGLSDWSQVDISVVETITDQLAQTLETLRLLDETESRAAQERMVAQATTRMRETMDVKAVLETAADEIYEMLGLEKVLIHLPAETDDVV